MKRKHAELIKAWADGAEIERDYENGDDNDGGWEVERHPSWRDACVYRIKQAEPSKIELLRLALNQAREAYWVELAYQITKEQKNET